MTRIIIVASTVVLFAAAAFAAPHISNSDNPRDGVQTLSFDEVWHRGDDDDDVMFGAVRAVRRGPDDDLYVLDTQLAQVFVFAPNGELLRTLSREGDGPGECRRPEDLVFLPDGSLGIVQYINGRIIRIDTEGTPLGSLMPPGETTEGGMANLRRVRCRGGSLVVNGVRMTPDGDDGMIRTQYLTACDDHGRPVTEILSRSTSSNLMRDGWIEKNNYFPSHERWDIDRRGRVLAAVDRNEYRITVYAPDGEVEFTFGRDYRPVKRTAEQKHEIAESLVVLREGGRVRVDCEVEDAAPAIQEVHVMDDGEIWVLPVTDREHRPDGVMQTYDVFTSDGVFVRQASVVCEGDPGEDSLFLLGPGRAVLVRGAVQARRNAFGGSRVEEDEVANHDLKMFVY